MRRRYTQRMQEYKNSMLTGIIFRRAIPTSTPLRLVSTVTFTQLITVV